MESSRRVSPTRVVPSFPLVAILAVYSLAATYWAARQTQKVNSLQSVDLSQGNLDTSSDIGSGSTSVDAVSMDGEEGSVHHDVCPLCHGQGVIIKEGIIEAFAEMPCPLCLGKARKRASPLKTLWGSVFED